ncbi:General stress protein CTC [Koleobacter methoxysyntrophicus]|uniref:Large ribosomal subunit protein bL25 n=1 Tax=Koleobacter methoxysyntrophicus TaxID=2751313 RepID=A0A8A0RLN0_9FIRM|nr:50S ribosomal protein L25/general stress protein Ctc [Koleobacter methoxysyntrophicus]QSQ08518.1 General stress protein CTC [Koleobacter methoxysyntrophicus]
MEQVQLAADLREGLGKGYARRIRNQGMVPGVLYGKDIENRQIMVDRRKLSRILKNYGHNVLIDLNVNGETNTVILREVQKDVIKDEILHVDFFKISLKDKIEVTVPLVLKGDPVGIKEGGVLQHQLREITIEALPTEIPEVIEVDISNLNVGEGITVKDINVPEGIEIVNEPEEIIALIVAPRIETEAEAEAEEEEEPELVKEAGKKEEEEE